MKFNSRVLQWAMAIALGVSQPSIGAQPNGYKTFQTEQGFHVSVPKGWKVYSANQLQHHGSNVKELTKQFSEQAPASSIIFAAETYDKTGARIAYASLMVYGFLPTTQYEVRQRTTELIALVTADLSDEFQKLVARGLMTEFRIVDARRVELDELSAIQVDYQRTTSMGDKSMVRLLKVYDGERSFTLTFSYREDVAFSMTAVRQAVIASFRKR
jgi:hypothetical protein